MSNAPFDPSEHDSADDSPFGPHSIGRIVHHATRPDWGAGRILEVLPMTQGGRRVFRLRIHWQEGGIRSLMVPPAPLIEPRPEPTRKSGWLDEAAGTTLDDRLRKLPGDLLETLGTPLAKLNAVLPWYSFDESPAGLLAWCRKLMSVRDPLSQWTRDELSGAFRAFCTERDGYLRNAAAVVRMREGEEALKIWLAELEDRVRESVLVALGRAI